MKRLFTGNSDKRVYIEDGGGSGRFAHVSEDHALRIELSQKQLEELADLIVQRLEGDKK